MSTTIFDKIEDVRSLAQIVVETVREPLLVLDDRLTILVASNSFHKSFQIAPDATPATLTSDLLASRLRCSLPKAPAPASRTSARAISATTKMDCIR